MQLRTEDERKKAERRLLRRQTKKKRKLQEAGIQYDFEAVAYVRFCHPLRLDIILSFHVVENGSQGSELN